MQTNLKIWDDVFKSKAWGKYPPIPLVKFIAKNFYSASNKTDVKILELGSGTGANLWFMAREGFTVYGIEGSKTACQMAKERLKNEHLEKQIGKIIDGNYFDLLDEFEDNYFDAIIDIESLYYNSFSKTKEILAKAIQKMKVNGKLFSFTFADGTWGTENVEEKDYHGVVPIEGPLSVADYGRYTTREDIDALYGFPNVEIYNVERADFYYMNGKVIKEWCIELEKISANNII